MWNSMHNYVFFDDWYFDIIWVQNCNYIICFHLITNIISNIQQELEYIEPRIIVN